MPYGYHRWITVLFANRITATATFVVHDKITFNTSGGSYGNQTVLKQFKGGVIYATLPVIVLACFHSTVLMLMIMQATHTTAS